MSDTDRMPLDGARRQKRLTFDPTINAGHVLTFITLVVAGFGAWSLMDKRVTVLERDAQHQAQRDSGQDAAIREKFEAIKESLNELKATVNDLRRQQR